MKLTKNHITIICSVIIVTNLICLPFWILGKHDIILNFQTAFNVFIVPFMICIFGSFKMDTNCTLTILIFWISGIIGNLISYTGWGLWSGEFLSPDTETVMIQMFAVQFQAYGALVAGLIQLLRFGINKYSTKIPT